MTMKIYQVELVAKIVGFLELTVEANSEEEAKYRAREDATKVQLYDWDIQYVDYFGDRNQHQDIEVNEIRELSKHEYEQQR